MIVDVPPEMLSNAHKINTNNLSAIPMDKPRRYALQCYCAGVTSLQHSAMRYKDKPTDTATYEIEGQIFIVTAHFVGEKNLDKVIYDHAFHRAMEDSETA